MNALLYRSLKMSIGFGLAIVIANFLGLQFAVSAGVIAMLNMLDNKKDSARVAWRRIYSSLVGLFISGLVFSLLGFEVINIALFLLLFIPVTIKLHAAEGIIVNTVLASHLIIVGNIDLAIMRNELLLVILGAVVALLLNLHMPNKEQDIITLQQQVEKQIRSLLWTMSLNMRNLCTIHDEEPSILELESLIKDAKKQSYIYMNNQMLYENNYYLEYFQMRQTQVDRLKYMREHLDMVFVDQGEAIILSKFTGRLAFEYNEGNDGTTLHTRLNEIKEDFQSSELPKTRLEFENRAALYQYLNDLEAFIAIKVRFSKKFAGHNKTDLKNIPLDT